MSGHDHVSLGANRILTLPKAGDSLLLGVELQARLAVESAGTTTGNTLLVTGEREHGKRDGNGHVDTELASLTLLLELRGGRAGACEDGGTVAVFVGVDHINGVVKGLNVETHENGTKDLLLVALHIGGDVGDDGWANLRGHS